MEIIDLEMIPGGPKKTCHASQFDNGRVIRFNLKENGQPFALSGTETVQAIIRKPDGSETTLDIANTESTYVDLITEADTCDIAGVNHCEMKVTEDGEDLGSGNFDMKVEEDAYGAGDVTVGTASGPIASFETGIKDELIECKGDISYRAEGYKQATFINSRSMPQKDTEPYLFRKAGGSLQNIGGQEHDTLVGGTVAFNQNIPVPTNDATTTLNAVTMTDNRDGSYTLNGTATADCIFTIVSQKTWKAHKYVLLGGASGGSTTKYSLAMRGAGSDSFDFGAGGVWNAEGNTWKGIVIYFKNGQTATNLTFKPQLIDITQMFGSTIADYIYGLEQATAGAGVAFFKKYFPKDYYPYNAGELISVKASGHITRGFNQFNKNTESEWKNYYVLPDGVVQQTPACKAAVIPCLPNTKYYAGKDKGSRLCLASYHSYPNPGDKADNGGILVVETGGHAEYTTGPNDHYLLVWFFNANIDTTATLQEIAESLCVNISGSRDGEYEPYEEHAYPLDDIELRGIPKLDSNNRLFFDGDEYADNGAVERRYGIVDLGSLNWTYVAPTGDRIYNFFSTYDLSTVIKNTTSITLHNGICGKFDVCMSSNIAKTGYNKCFAVGGVTLFISDNNYTDATAFKASLSGVYLVYEKATPTAETADPFTNPQAVSKYGTEEYIDGRTVEMPVGHSTIYGDDIQAKRATFPERIYGGSINLTTGELESTKNADGTDKETPDTYQLTPQNFETRSGQNNIMNNTNGDTAVKFYTRA